MQVDLKPAGDAPAVQDAVVKVTERSMVSIGVAEIPRGHVTAREIADPLNHQLLAVTGYGFLIATHDIPPLDQTVLQTAETVMLIDAAEYRIESQALIRRTARRVFDVAADEWTAEWRANDRV